MRLQQIFMAKSDQVRHLCLFVAFLTWKMKPKKSLPRAQTFNNGINSDVLHDNYMSIVPQICSY